MIVECTRTGEIRTGPEAWGDGVNAIGVVRGRVDPNTLLIEPWKPKADDLRNATDRDLFYTHGYAAFWRVAQGRLVYAAPDIAGVHDVFYGQTRDGGWRLSDDFMEMAASYDALELDVEAVRYFITHGYFYGASTFFKGLRRVRAGARLVFDKNGPREESLFATVFSGDDGRPRTYQGFKDILASVCRAEAPGTRDAILLSGGWDSGLLAAQMRQVTTEPIHAVTYAYRPEKDSNQEDLHVAAQVASLLKLRHQVVTMDINALALSMLDPLVDRMPLAAQMALIVLEGTRSLRDVGIERVWCGQNADSIYNLGPTSRLAPGQGKIDLIKRLYLGRPFIESLRDVQGRGTAWPARATAHVGRFLAERHFRGASFRVPENVNELLAAFRGTENYLALLPRDHPSEPPLTKPVSSLEVRKMLFDEKLSSFLVGRDPRVMHYGPLQNGLDPVRPFASPALLLYFRGLELGWRDVWSPKRYIRDYLRELLGVHSFKGIYGRQAKRPPALGKKTALWQQDLIQQSRSGRELAEMLASLPAPWASYAGAGKLQYNVSLYWFARIMKRLGRPW